jgi:hypothetical protein
LIAYPPWIVERRHVPLLLPDLGPDFVNLDPATAHLTHLLIHQVRAAFANLDKQAVDRIPMCVVILSVERIEFPSTKHLMI